MSFLGAIGWVLNLSYVPLITLFMLSRIEKSTYWGGLALLDGGCFILSVIHGDKVSAVITGVFAVIAAYYWWKNRRKGKWKRAAKELGAKSRARVEALARQMTPSPIPSPVGA